MRVVWLVTVRELGAYFRSYMGYIILAVVLLVDGLLFNVYALGGGSKFSAEVLRQFFYFSSGTTMIASIFLTMRLLAEERQMGTMVLYMPTSHRSVVGAAAARASWVMAWLV